MDVPTLEVAMALAISPAITSPPVTDTTGSSDCDHCDQDRDETTIPVVMEVVDVMVCHPHHNRNWIEIGIDRER